MNPPNLFNFATRELSQDALLCWLLSWSDPHQQANDNELYQLGRTLLSALISEAGGSPTSIERVEVLRQYRHLDVLCRINDDLVLMIEDKTGTQEHSGQLGRYRAMVEQDFPQAQVLGIYYKTEEQSCFSGVRQAGFQPFLRRHMLDVLRTYQGDNAIVLDYREHLESIQTKVNGFRTLPLEQWQPRSRTWQGFYQWLQKELGIGDDSYRAWDYVANPSGGYMGLWWSFQGTDDPDAELSLQLMEHRLCIKINVDANERRSELRKHFYHRVMTQVNELGLPMAKPARFGHGNFMTLCEWQYDYRVADSEGRLDSQATLARLQALAPLMERLASA